MSDRSPLMGPHLDLYVWYLSLCLKTRILLRCADPCCGCLHTTRLGATLWMALAKGILKEGKSTGQCETKNMVLIRFTQVRCGKRPVEGPGRLDEFSGWHRGDIQCYQVGCRSLVND